MAIWQRSGFLRRSLLLLLLAEQQQDLNFSRNKAKAQHPFFVTARKKKKRRLQDQNIPQSCFYWCTSQVMEPLLREGERERERRHYYGGGWRGDAEMTVSRASNAALKWKGQVVIAGRLIETNRGERPQLPAVETDYPEVSGEVSRGRPAEGERDTLMMAATETEVLFSTSVATTTTTKIKRWRENRIQQNLIASHIRLSKPALA